MYCKVSNLNVDDLYNVIRGEAAHRLPTHDVWSITTRSKMDRSSKQAAEIEANIQAAITAYEKQEYKSVRAAALAFSVPASTLRARLAGTPSRSHAHESAQILSSTEEKTLVRWISRLCRTGFPASPKLVVEMAEEIRRARFQLTQWPSSSLRPIGEHWIDRFRIRHPEIQGIWTRQIESVRHNAINTGTVKKWFDAVTELQIQHHYPPDCIYNMDESGFAVGTSQSSRVLVNIRKDSS